MSPRNRALLRWAFILIFLILAPVIILSTAGYRFNFGKGRLERTGVIVVDTTPSGARVTLNGRIVDTSTPARIARVSPGDYRAVVTKPGFRPWEKDVTVDESQTLFLNDIVLLRNDIPTFERDQAQAVASAFSPDSRFAAVASDDRGVIELHVFDFKTGVDRLPYRAPVGTSASYQLTWSSDSEQLLIARTDNATLTYYQWSVDNPLSTSEVSASQAQSVVPASSGTNNPLSLLPASTNARGAEWSSDGKRLLYWNDLEVHVYDPTAKSDDLVTRISGTIKKAVWYAGDRLILYASDDGLSAIESGHEGARVTTPLATMQDISDFAISKSGDTAWIVGAIGHEQGVFSLKLQ